MTKVFVTRYDGIQPAGPDQTGSATEFWLTYTAHAHTDEGVELGGWTYSLLVDWTDSSQQMMTKVAAHARLTVAETAQSYPEWGTVGPNDVFLPEIKRA